MLFTTAVDIINTLSAAQAHGNLKRELRKYLQPRLLQIDELGYLPIDKQYDIVADGLEFDFKAA